MVSDVSTMFLVESNLVHLLLLLHYIYLKTLVASYMVDLDYHKTYVKHSISYVAYFSAI